MQLLLVNDDGIHAPGIAALERAVKNIGRSVTIAPDKHYSGCGHQATTNRGLLLTELSPGRYMLDGTPADCTRIGLTHLAPDVDWVLAGINEGGNLGADIYMSGTVAAVREAALLGKPGIAVSHYVRREMAVDWDQAAAWTEHVVRRLLKDAAECTAPLAGVYWSVNLPHCEPGSAMPQIVFCPSDGNPLPVKFEVNEGRLHYRGNYHQRLRTPGGDVDVCFRGHIAVTRLTI